MKKIAIIGSGVSGLTAAYLLSKKHEVHVFEKNDIIGGHTATVDVEYKNEHFALDTGFIVFNNKTYPNFLTLLDELGVGKQETEMSFSVRNCDTGLEYNGHNLDTLFAQRSNLFKPKFWFLIKEILRFNKLCKKSLEGEHFPENYSLGDFLREHSFKRHFTDHYILPMGAAIWSCSLEQMEAFQYKFFVEFFNHHGLLNIADRPQWYVIPKGSRNYLGPLTKPFEHNIHVGADIQSITRENGSVQLLFKDKTLEFDEVVLACHSDQALALLGDSTSDENNVLTAMPYSENSVVLHTDKNLLPSKPKAWASWNYQLSPQRDVPASVTYNMNILQGLDTSHTFCVTLNQKEAIAPEKILREFTYHHPAFSVDFVNAQRKRHLICGVNKTHFAGAYWYNGFHEDGVRSAVEVAERFGCYLNKDAPTTPNASQVAA
jgi:predicted NAD/FAD-binding protein